MLTGELEALTRALSHRFRFLREIGRGGSGVVFLCDDLEGHRQVAIKVLRVELAGAKARQRFLREIRIASELDHPNILPLLESGSVDETLYYVMPLVEGESLQQRMKREGQLPVEEAVRIAGDVLLALEHAHNAGIVHRDVKPGNILLEGERVLVADFGIARAIHRTAFEESISSPGTHVGTPAYMSPEQAAGDDTLDGRSDLYSLGCVLYEMLAGAVPFTGASGTAVIARHALDPVPSLRTVRRTVPRALERLVLRVLQKSPADRFASASEMLAALRAAAGPAELAARTGIRLEWSRWAMALLAIGIVSALAGVWFVRRPPTAASRSAYIVFPFQAPGPPRLDAAERLRESLRDWSGITVRDWFTTRGALTDTTGASLSPAAARTIAATLRAGRYVLGRCEQVGEAIRVTTTVFDVDSGRVADASVVIPADPALADSGFRRLAEQLLFPGVVRSARFEPRIGTSSLLARRAFLQGQARVREWELPGADSAFFRADSLDPTYARASLWLALVRFWRMEPAARWRDLAAQASMAADFSSDEQALASALVAWAGGAVAEACETFERRAALDPGDPYANYSAGECRSRDSGVYRDASSPTGWHFRSSQRLALSYYERALRIAPSIYRGLRQDGFAQLRTLLKTAGNDLRPGSAIAPDTGHFVAYPTLAHDTLAFYPIPRGELPRFAPRFLPSIPAALRQQRQLLRDWTMTWASNYPQSSEAWEAVALAMEFVGDASALDTIAKARLLARTAGDAQRVRGTQAWMLVKFSVPSDLPRLRQARAIADSVLSDGRESPADRRLVVSLAALTGRLAQARRLARDLSNWPRSVDPAELNAAAGAMLLVAAMGGADAELQALGEQTDSLIGLVISRGQRENVRSALLGRAATLAVASHPEGTRLDSTFVGRVSHTVAAVNYPLYEILQVWLRGDSVATRRRIDALAQERRFIPVSDVQVDALLPESWLIAAVEDDSTAAAWLNPTLIALRASSMVNFLEPTRAAALVRSMALRAELAAHTGDQATAKVWGQAVIELWANCDPELRPLVERMRTLTR